jgi:hypothetical protein
MTRKIFPLLSVFIFLFSLSACQLFQPTAAPGAQVISPIQDLTQAPPTPAPKPSNTAAIPAPVEQGTITLQIVSPQDGAVVTTPLIEVIGLASPGAVVSVNDILFVVGADGHFQTTVSLEQGPNLIEVIASNEAGKETWIELVVNYES